MIDATATQVRPAVNTSAPTKPIHSPMPGLSPLACRLSRYSATPSPAMAARNPIGIATQPGQVGGPGASSSNRGRVRPLGSASGSGAAATPGAANDGGGSCGTEPGVVSGLVGGAGSNGRDASKRGQELVARRRALVSGASSGARS